MKRIIAVVGILAALAITGCASGTSAVQTVDPQAFLSTTAQQGVVVVDVRIPRAKEGHVRSRATSS